MGTFALPLTTAITALGSATLKATVLLVLAALVVPLLRRRSAAVRHLIWTVALGGAVALLVLPAVLPAWRVVPLASSPRAAVRDAASLVARVPAQQGVSRRGTRRSTVEVARPIEGAVAAPSPLPAIRPALATLVFVLWLAGVAGIVARYTWSRISLGRLARRSSLADRRVVDPRIVREMRIARRVCIRTSAEVALPMTWGIVHPQIVLPADAVEWTAECRRHVVQHELAHIRRLDAATQLVAQAASALLWFHPLVWFAVGQMRRERERACDDCVLAGGAVASDYASDLLALVTSHGYADRHAVALAFARRSHFEGRLLALLDPTVDRGFVSPRGVALTVGVSLALVAPLAAMQNAVPGPAQRAKQAEAERGTPAQTAVAPRTGIATPKPTSSRAAVRETSAPSPVVSPTQRLDHGYGDIPAQSTQPASDLFASCTDTSAHGGSHHDSEWSRGENGRALWTSSGEFGGCSFDLRAEGEVVFGADGTSIDRMGDGAYLDVMTNIRGDVSRFSARRAPDGTVAYQLAKSGSSGASAVASDVWLAQFLIGLDRTTAFAVDRRLPALLQAGGPPLVLSDIEQMYTSRAKSVYAERLLRSATLDPGSVRRMAAVVSSLNGDHSAADLLVAITDRYPLTDPVVHGALLGTALTMHADYEMARSFLSLVTKSELSPSETLAMLESIKRMTVDAEKTRVLLAVAGSQRLDGDARSAFTAAAESIRQPYERDRAMAAIR